MPEGKNGKRVGDVKHGINKCWHNTPYSVQTNVHFYFCPKASQSSDTLLKAKNLILWLPT